MRSRLIATLAVLVVVPLIALGWVGARLAADQRRAVGEGFDALVEAKLADTEATISRAMRARERALIALCESFPADPPDIRRLARRDPRFAHALVLDPEGKLLFPPPAGPLSESERAFLERTRGLWQGGGLRPRPAQHPADRQRGESPPEHGWTIWYWGGGLNLIFWWRPTPGDRLIAVEVDRIALLAELVAVLPATSDDSEPALTALLDESGQPLYQWGGAAGSPTGHPHLERPLSAPLQGWRLAWYGQPPPQHALISFQLLGGLGAIALALIGLATYFYRASTSELRRAARRVSFVNRVSHELKTPLTSIRMYAELLEQRLEGEDETLERYVGVIATQSRRLSRLITNILSFARHQRDQLAVRPAPAVPDEIIRGVLEEFQPALTAVGIEAFFEPGAGERRQVDADALGQILGNLLGNVEKYARGGRVWIRSRQREGWTEITVADEGPGIPRAQAGRIFEPFQRLGGALSEGVTGTGIGLAIARELARLHGGDLTLRPSDEGACFEVQIRTEVPT